MVDGKCEMRLLLFMIYDLGFVVVVIADCRPRCCFFEKRRALLNWFLIVAHHRAPLSLGAGLGGGTETGTRDRSHETHKLFTLSLSWYLVKTTLEDKDGEEESRRVFGSH